MRKAVNFLLTIYIFATWALAKAEWIPYGVSLLLGSTNPITAILISIISARLTFQEAS